jgi:hypothetical protein
MATAEKGGLLKNVKVKIKDKDDKDKESGSNKEINFNISAEEEKDKASSHEDKKEIVNAKLDISGHEENSNSKVIKEKSEEKNNSQNSSEEEKKSEKKSEYNYKNTSEKEGSNKLKESKDSKGSHSGSENNNKSSFLNSNHYNNLQNENDNFELNDSNEEENDSCFIDRSKPFMTTGKFMQIQPHFNIFSQQVEDLHNGLYDNTKKCLIYKSSLQDSENLIRERANSVVRDLVDKIFNLRQMLNNSNKAITMTINEVNQNVIKVTEMQARTKKEINDCDHRINDCEGQIGYKLLGKPNYSFMKRMCQTATK